MKPRIGPRETVYRNRHQEVYRVRLAFDLAEKELFVTDYGCRAAVVVEGPSGILLTRQYRYLIDRLSWEIPGGRVDDGESTEMAARRECLEETGVTCRSLCPLIAFHPGLDTLHNPTHLFWSSDIEPGTRGPSHANEVVECVWIPLEECVCMMFRGEIVDSISQIGLMAYSLRREHRLQPVAEGGDR